MHQGAQALPPVQVLKAEQAQQRPQVLPWEWEPQEVWAFLRALSAEGACVYANAGRPLL